GGNRSPQTPSAPLGIRLAYRPPFDRERMLGFLAARAIPGVEEMGEGRYGRTMMLPNGPGLLSLAPASGYVDCELQLEDLRDPTAAVQRCRRLLDLDADPEAVTGYLSVSGPDPVLGPLALANPGRRSPGHVDGNELALRAVLGQQVSVTAARRLGARLVAAYGKPLSRPDGPLTHCFPEAGTLAAADPAALPMPRGPCGRRAGGELAALAFLRRPPPVGVPRREGSMMTSPFVAPDRDAPRLSHIVSSPIGRLLLLGDGQALTGLWMIDAERHTSR